VAEHVSGLQFLIACIVGFETGPRVGKALYGDDVLKRGWHSGPLFGSPAAAAAASKLFDLSPEQTEDAIGIACTQAGGLMSAQYEGMVKRAQHGFAARNGLLGALLARGNYKGIKKVFERPYGGFLAMFSSGNGKKISYKEWEIVDRLGTFWHTYTIRIKLYACMGTLHGTLEALENLQRKHPELFRQENLPNITSINVGLSDASYAHGGWPVEERPMTSTGSQMSGQYCVALQLVDRQVLLDQFKEGALDRNEVWDLVYKTNCFHSSEFDKPDHLSGSHVTISFLDGTTVEEVVNMPKGFDPPLPNELIREKYRRLVSPIMSEERMMEVENAVLSLDELDDVRGLLQKLTGQVGKALA
jgi:aconitate decarboxylase